MSLNAKEPPKVAITRRSRVHGVVITQVVQQVPVGKSTPDFIRKPMAMTINEGRRAFFKATVSGEPTPSVTWGRNKGDVNDADKYKIKYEEKSKEHILEIPQAKPELADTYKCFATNEYGTAVCSATLIVIKAKDDEPQDFRKMLKKTVVVTKKKQLPPKEGELDPKLLEVLLTAPKKDYQRICLDFGVTDFRWLLKRLNQLKKERADEQAKVVENIGNVRQIEVKPSGKAEFSLDMTLLDPNSKIYLYKDGNRVPYGNNGNSKHSLQKRGNTYCFTIKDPQPEDAGLYQVDVGETTVLTTDFQVPAVSFADKINNTKALENKDASFQCVLSTPLNRITWSTSDSSLEHGDKYEINVSEDKLTHTLTIKNCEKADNGTYYAIAGTASCKASLVVEADPNAHKGLKKSKDQHELAKLEIEDTKEKDRQNESSGKIGAGVGDDSSGTSDITKDDWSHDSHGWKGKSENNNNLLGGRDESQKVDAGKERVQAGLTVSDAAQDQGVQFVSGLSDATAVTGGRAELFCKLSTENAKGRWYKNGKLLTDDDGVQIIQDGAHHKLIIDCCNKEDGAVYRFESDGRKSEATLNIQDPPKVDASALVKFTKPVVVKAGETAEWKLQFSGGEPMKIQWSKDDDELLPALNMRIEKSATSSKLRLAKCQRKDSGEIKIKIKNEFGTTEAISKLIVLDKPTPPQGPVEILESALTSVEFKWKPPKDDGGCPITNYIIERQLVGRNKWSSLGQIGGNSTVYRDSDVEPGKRYCYRIRAKNSEGVSDCLQTEAIAAGVLRYPGAPSPPKVVRACKDCISLAWSAPCNTGGTKIVGFNLEKRKKGTNNWSLVNQEGPIKDSKYEVKDVCEGVAYEFRVSAINLSGPGDPSNPSDAVIARDPMKPPGKVTDLRVTSSDYVTLSLAWTKPKEVKGSQDEAQGYYVEIRPVASSDWTRCNGVPITTTTYTVRGLKAMAAYWVRVVATNYGGDGEPRGFDNHIIAMPPPVWPKFKDRNLKNFVVVRAGNTVRLNIPFEASPFPEVSWLKDGALVPKHVTVTNSDKASQMLIPTSERSDSGVYTVIVKNLVGQESFNVEIRVTDDPKPPGPVELYQNVPGTVTVSWAPSPDETKDDRLHYVISKRDSFKPTWRTVAENLFNNKFTVVDIVPGRQYHFRVYAKNDMGLSAPSVSPAFEIKKERERFKVNVPQRKSVDLSSAPSFITPLRRHIPPEGYECHMSCAVKGDPAPRVAWYHDDVDLSVNSNYYITNVCGVCSLLILRVDANDGGEYKVVVENHLGSAESSMMLKVREKRTWTMEATTEYL
ncbi:immunoglobulin-like and fibronectin type III domain-containing protein 1 [Syngnathus scovelli]|uniref:immunoglobulin-like and fibronectin type III domain-containing protein 1 n=1 Tax=Syngnathus scovelli TaxID=161590 RepID=UPI00210F966A|nr:immunoglobulin-like and fibronectin type III domain-containing protein 1 [Syngnathus scovelli]XP_049590910.1 immunoglobulin-like and fibronectin type III domain-containing protein 1 [Syngnathus scovelli]